ncbi:expressed unknown protein [Ectocarpus siliculosus]|uniref:Uncharacterized protein n=1 Tax=Ectocarpus siliculosus TaxID=2880 RepID=D7G4A6_ECTSI|nr:expressed unknown protein [Ectocarpus siliculosus]|eukprot:CBJ27121.1 expressed unknown protein [Ectocarpus siliculosus]
MSGSLGQYTGVIAAVVCGLVAVAGTTAVARKWKSGGTKRRMLGNIASGREFLDALSAEVADLEATIALAAEASDLDTARKENERKSREHDEHVTQVLTHLDKCTGGDEIGVARKKQIHRAEVLGLRISKILPGGPVDG